MSYQVLARKWRPAQFSEVVGQSHIVAALSNALDQGRVHHAFLFTGTRGVGKTTLARIFAKALNCEQGVSSTPCGQCNACVAVAEGRFIDLIEVDAASRTRVDDTRELLENVQYAPTQGRYKVYLIDEVHMLSTHSFNALLKTLEEPPEHVKFLLATTDPQKLPMTVLSRCIQFSLNAIEPQAIETQLATILDSEQITYEPAALTLLARAADGSLRDALSLLDQGIAFSNQQLSERSIRDMLGLVDSQIIVSILDALLNADMDALMSNVKQLIHAAQDLKTALDDLLSWLHALALYQFSPEAVKWKGLAPEEVTRLASAYSPETIQLFYQIVLNGKRDFTLAPDSRTGFEMVLLRLLAFKPGSVQIKPTAIAKPTSAANSGSESPSASYEQALARQSSPAQVVTQPGPDRHTAKADVSPAATTAPAATASPATVAEEVQPFLENGLQNADLQRYLKPASAIAQPPKKPEPEPESASTPVSTPAGSDTTGSGTAGPGSVQQKANYLPKEMMEISALIDNINVWSDFVVKVGLSGMTRQLVVQMTPLSYTDGILYLQLDSRYSNLQTPDRTQQIGDALQKACGQQFKLDIEFAEVSPEKTAAGVIAQRERNQLEKTRQDFNDDENVKEMVSLFNAQVDDSSIKPVN